MPRDKEDSQLNFTDAVRTILIRENQGLKRSVSQWARCAKVDPKSLKLPILMKNGYTKKVLNELLQRRQQRISDAIVDPDVPKEVKNLLWDCMPLWKDEPDETIEELLPQRFRLK